MCANGVDLGHTCRLCGKPLLSCWDDGPSISWHMHEADARACAGMGAVIDISGAGLHFRGVPVALMSEGVEELFRRCGQSARLASA